MSKHTPGPWIPAAAISSVVGLPVVTGKGRLVCNVNHAHDPMHGKVAGDDAFNREALANAQLIAAAPELLEALKDAMRSTRKDFKAGEDGDRQHEQAWAEQFAAIAKATGGQP